MLVRRGAHVSNPSQLLGWACGRRSVCLFEAVIQRFCAVGSTTRDAILAEASPDAKGLAFCAIIYGNEEIALALIEAGFAFSQTDFCFACDAQRFALVQAMLDRGADPNSSGVVARENMSKHDQQEYRRAVANTPLYLACQVKLMLSHPGFDLEDLTSLQANTLMEQATKTVVLLLERGAVVSRLVFSAILRFGSNDMICAILEHLGTTAGYGDSVEPLLHYVISQRQPFAAVVSRRIAAGEAIIPAIIATAIQRGWSAEVINVVIKAKEAQATSSSSASLQQQGLPLHAAPSSSSSSSSVAVSTSAATGADGPLLTSAVQSDTTAVPLLPSAGAAVTAEAIFEACKLHDDKQLEQLLSAASPDVRTAALTSAWPYDHERTCSFGSRCASRYRYHHQPARAPSSTSSSNAAGAGAGAGAGWQTETTHNVEVEEASKTAHSIPLVDIAIDELNPLLLHVLLKHGGVVFDPCTALVYACGAGAPTSRMLVQILLEHSRHVPADLDAVCGYTGKTALNAAASKGRIRVASLLLQHGVTIDATDSTGRTALQRACESGCFNTACFLLWQRASRRQPGRRFEIPGLPSEAELEIAAADAEEAVLRSLDAADSVNNAAAGGGAGSAFAGDAHASVESRSTITDAAGARSAVASSPSFLAAHSDDRDLGWESDDSGIREYRDDHGGSGDDCGWQTGGGYPGQYGGDDGEGNGSGYHPYQQH